MARLYNKVIRAARNDGAGKCSCKSNPTYHNAVSGGIAYISIGKPLQKAQYHSHLSEDDGSGNINEGFSIDTAEQHPAHSALLGRFQRIQFSFDPIQLISIFLNLPDEMLSKPPHHLNRIVRNIVARQTSFQQSFSKIIFSQRVI